LKNFRRQAKSPVERENALLYDCYIIELTLNKLYAIFHCLHTGPSFRKILNTELPATWSWNMITRCDTSNTTVNHTRQFVCNSMVLH